MPKIVAASSQLHPLAAYDELTTWWVTTSRALAGTGRYMLLIAGANLFSVMTRPSLTVVAYAFASDHDEVAEKLAFMESAPGLQRALVHMSAQPMSIPQIYGLFDQMYPEGLRYLSDNVWISDTRAPNLWNEAKQVIDTLPTSRSAVWLIPGMKNCTHPNAAFSLQSDLSFQVYAAYEDSAEDESMLKWHSEAMARMDPFSLGAGYVGDSNLFVNPVAILHPDNAERLEIIRAQHDPDGISTALRSRCRGPVSSHVARRGGGLVVSNRICLSRRLPRIRQTWIDVSDNRTEARACPLYGPTTREVRGDSEHPWDARRLCRGIRDEPTGIAFDNVPRKDSRQCAMLH
ncbi:hypothetical protein [Mycolicibacterium sp. YH-1]|uniref:hypothetical protein n=1 Tax=Mycolicibacterium sp. YH-1 TaxID=2908837 RepID=UPI001F4C1F59|nr:hypothetical protein [Mycolicibacterium sp. YH-1]UNB54527.1 hypothetical protein L0M16_09500 [Mycolicibacterium sp. YH-1]